MLKKKIVIYPYKLASESAKALADSLSCKRVRPDGNYKYFNSHLVVNWGSSINPNWLKAGAKVLNSPAAITVSSNKLSSLNKLKASGVRTPDFTTDINVAKQWIKDDYSVMCRTKLKSHSGNGIKIAFKEEDLIESPLYSKYVEAKDEFRIHVYWSGKENETPVIFDAAQKRKKAGIEKNEENKYNYMIRSHSAGYVFCRDNLVVPDDVKTQAIAAIKALNLNFAGIDIRYKQKSKEAYVLEANTGIGLQGITLDRYSKLFTNLLNNKPIETIN